MHENPRTEYEIAPQALLEAVETTENGPLELVGFYHSHPRGYAAFSQTDRENAQWDGATYLLCSLDPLAFLAAKWTGDAFDAVPVQVEINDAASPPNPSSV